MKKFLAITFTFLLIFTTAACAKLSVAEKDAPDFTIQLSDGTTKTLSQLKGKAVLVHFWATWCPPCRQELPGMNALAKKLIAGKNTKLEFIGICVSDTEKNRASFMSENKYTFPCGLDENGAIAATKYNVQGIPTTILISPNGKILKQNVGMMTEGQLAEFVKEYVE